MTYNSGKYRRHVVPVLAILFVFLAAGCSSDSSGTSKITEELVKMVMGWRHSGFNVFCGSRIQPGSEDAMENLARYIIRASFSQERMTYIPEKSKVVYRSKDGKEEKAFDALEWPAAMCSHVPNKGQQMVRYLGFYSNVAKGKRKKNDQDELIPSILEPHGLSGEYKRNWARLIQKIYEVDPLTCPRCSGKMKVISIIECPEIIKKILRHPRPTPHMLWSFFLDLQSGFFYSRALKKQGLITSPHQSGSDLKY